MHLFSPKIPPIQARVGVGQPIVCDTHQTVKTHKLSVLAAARPRFDSLRVA
jgi:hypothetical protein